MIETRVEYWTELKAQLPPGPWQNEPDKKQWQDPATRLPCLAVRNELFGHWCGYVGVLPGHKLHGRDYPHVPDFDVHGGLTYAAFCQGHVCHAPADGESESAWWFGFDCAHLGDRLPGTAPPSERATYRDLAFVEQQCAQLARQLAESA